MAKPASANSSRTERSGLGTSVTCRSGRRAGAAAVAGVDASGPSGGGRSGELVSGGLASGGVSGGGLISGGVIPGGVIPGGVIPGGVSFIGSVSPRRGCGSRTGASRAR
jgi:hypothetical protein